MTQAIDAPADILIVDDHPLFAAGFIAMARVLRPGWVLRTAASAAEAHCRLRQEVPALALVDVGLPGNDGFALLQAIRAGWPGLPTVLISGRDDEAVRVRARAGKAAGFIAKTAGPDTIVRMLDVVLRGGVAFAASEGTDGENAAGKVCMPTLTNRQAEILELLAEGCPNKEIRHRLGIAERTVRAHLTELFHLLGVSSRMQAVIRGRELGLVAG